MAEQNIPQSAGDLLRILLNDKGWTQEELALITGRSRQTIMDILAGRTGVSPEMAIALSAAFGNQPADWLLLQYQSRLAQVQEDPAEIVKRVKLFEAAPIRDMQRRGWIAETKEISGLEEELKQFFETDEVDDDMGFPVATRRTIKLARLNKWERAWCFRARHLAKAVHTEAFREKWLDVAERELRRLAAYPKEAAKVSEILIATGIKFVVVEPLPRARIDGATFWLDESSPVIAMSLRFDRIDSFWFTLMHELSHVRHADALSVDTDLEDGMKTTAQEPEDESEKRANAESAASLLPPAELDSFIRRVGPLYSKPRIIQFAHRMKIHPGIIVGQLHHKAEIGPSSNREMLAKIRHAVVETALTDGWGRIAPSHLL